MSDVSDIQLAAATGDSAILSRIGTQAEREELLRVMSGQLGIPGDAFKSNPSVIPVLASAASKYMHYGWMPGVHMHTVSFSTKTKSGQWIDQYTLIDGEKAWRDTAERYRHEYGVQWFEQWREMAEEDLRMIAQEQRMPITSHVEPAGIWCRVIRADKAMAAKGLEDTEFAYSPEWESGIWTGERTVGSEKVISDPLPMGRTGAQTARRRALKSAIMAQFTPIPLDGRGERERLDYMVEELRRESAYEDRYTSLPIERSPLKEENGLVLATR